MKELLEIIKAYRQARTPTALATLVQTTGSSYRRAGARMLILPDGKTVGCLSGGCLDQDVVSQAMEIIKNHKPALITYDTSSDQDIVFGAGLGCKGVIDILLEFLPVKTSAEESAPTFLDFLEDVIQHRCAGASATVIERTGRVELAVGDRITLNELGNGTSNAFYPQAADVLEKCAQSALASLHSGITPYEAQNGSARIFVETILPQTHLVILGAGHDAMPLARLAAELGVRISIVDARPEYATRERFPLADKIITARPEENGLAPLFDARTAAVIMTHNYLLDQAWLKRLLPLGLPYLGLMGPRKRAQKILLEMRREGFDPSERDLRSLHNPTGLDIGAETPEQIALAILAEIHAVLAGRGGSKLKQKKEAIHLSPLAEEIACVASA